MSATQHTTQSGPMYQATDALAECATPPDAVEAIRAALLFAEGTPWERDWDAPGMEVARAHFLLALAALQTAEQHLRLAALAGR